jgi:hypothetical protein
MSKKVILTIGLFVISILMALYELIAYLLEIYTNEYLLKISSTVFLFMLVMWVVEDGRSRKNIYKPYEFGFLVLIFWLPYIPYYFVKTRGLIGVMYLLGLLLLLTMGLLLQWGYYYAT